MIVQPFFFYLRQVKLLASLSLTFLFVLGSFGQGGNGGGHGGGTGQGTGKKNQKKQLESQSLEDKESQEPQLTHVDSLELNLEERDLDTNLINDYIELSWYYYDNNDSAKAYDYAQSALETSDQLKNQLKLGQSKYVLGLYYKKWGEDEHEISTYLEALQIFRKGGYVDDELRATLQLAYAYERNDQINKAFDLYQDALLRYPDNHLFACVINSNIGSLMKSIDESETAIEYFDKSEEHFVQIENPSIMVIREQLSNDKNRGVLYRNKDSFDTAFFYMNRSLQKSIEINDSIWMARNYNSLGILYLRTDKYAEAIHHYEKSLTIKKATNYNSGVITTLCNLAILHTKIDELNKAEAYIDEAQTLCAGSCPLRRHVALYKAAANLYGKQKRYQKAYEALDKYVTLRDSLDEEDQKEYTRELEAKYQSEANKIEQEKLQAELIAADLREQNKTEQIKRQRNIMILSIVAGIILLGLVFISIRSNIKRKAANNLLQEKNVEIVAKSEKIEQQKHQIEIKNQEMMDSITYAKRIQEAILPNLEFFKSQLPDSFIYYEPKDVLAGDFYWMDVVGDTIIWAAADCTGHGIPGAMVSVVCHNALNRSVHEFGLTDPGKILDNTRDLVIQSFEKSGMDVKDGMDIALCCLDKKTNKLKFAGANNPLWIIRDSSTEKLVEKDFVSEDGTFVLKEIKGDKQPVGHFYQQSPFTTSEVEIKKNDQLFVFTDGFADQFGGEKGKKLKYKNFKKLILQNSKESLEEHLNKLDEAFQSWKGDFEQLDDVCVIGVRIK
jgi:tetratricopeptide (TPR) repeat protein